MQSIVILGNLINEASASKIDEQFFLEDRPITLGLLTQSPLTLSGIQDPDYKVVVKKNAFSCNYRDKAIILYHDAFIKEQCSKGVPAFCYIGSEFTGEVIEIGNKVKGFKVGDRVIPNIAYPSYDNAYVPGLPSNHGSKRFEIFSENKLLSVPDNMSDEIAACFPIAAFTAYSMIRKVVKPKAKVLITAAKSNTSLAVISALKNFDVELYAMTSTGRDLDILKSMGVKQTFVVDHSASSYLLNSEIAAVVKESGGFDAVIDPMFDIHLSRVIELMNYDSKYVTCGIYNQYPDFDTNPATTPDLNFNHIMTTIMIKNISIIGNCIGLEEDYLKALEHFNQGTFDILIDKIFTKGQETDFFQLSYDFKERMGKVVYMYE